MSRRMINLRRAWAGLLVGFGVALPAYSKVDCNYSFGQSPDTTFIIVAYVNPDTIGATGNDLQRLRQRFNADILQNYTTSLGDLWKKSNMQLQMFICEKGDVPSLIDNGDLAFLATARALMQLWRTKEADAAVVTHAIIPRIARETPSRAEDLNIMLVDRTEPAKSVESWRKSIASEADALKALTGLALGLRYLDVEKDALIAKLLLCKSRADLKLSLAEFGDDRSVSKLVDALVAEADTKASRQRGEHSAHDVTIVNTACEASAPGNGP
ncbi:MAG: hypothetical protein JSR59_19925 [Proteobacteria bacterium]|nr:hypothetical protein [Pseudomonadota bacterium]